MCFPILLIDIYTEGSPTGVDRYLESLCLYLKNRIQVIRLVIIAASNRLGVEVKEETEDLVMVYIPFPELSRSILKHPNQLKEYSRTVTTLLGAYPLNRPRLIHLQTHLLFPLASLLRDHLPGSKIITHLHNIPWKGYINRDISHFNRLYYKYCIEGCMDMHLVLISDTERETYTKSDHIICLTECAREFVGCMYPSSAERVSIIPNGLSDWTLGFERAYNAKEQLRLIFVGTLSRGKGLDYILEAMSIAQESGVRLAIDVAGTCNDSLKKEIHRRYPELSISLHGRVERDELIALYRRADIGVIASLQEQCSYVAIEMCMMGLPIITTAIDGLDEMFEDEVNALKVPVSYSRIRGLSVDTEYYAKCIVRLATVPTLRERLGTSARKLYLERYTANIMGERTIGLYNKILGDNE